MHKKAGFELLTDEARQSWFTTEERKAIRDWCRGRAVYATAARLIAATT